MFRWTFAHFSNVHLIVFVLKKLVFFSKQLSGYRECSFDNPAIFLLEFQKMFVENEKKNKPYNFFSKKHFYSPNSSAHAKWNFENTAKVFRQKLETFFFRSEKK